MTAFSGRVRLPEGVRRERIEPLWARVDRNRAKLAFFVAAYLASIALSAALIATVAALLFVPWLVATPETAVAYYWRIGGIARAAAAVALVLGSVWTAYAMLRSEKRLLKRLGAKLTPTGQYHPTKLALKDMALAAGFAHAPPLWVITDCERINAFAVGRTHRGAVIGITKGFADRLDPDDQRAVLANLMARLTNGDVKWATAVSALVGPIWRLRERDIRRGELDPADPMFAEAREAAKRRDSAAAGALVYFALYVFLIVITEVLLVGHERSARLTAEKADAEGMLLLKDPRTMLHALEHVLEANNTVPTAGETYSDLFYCWAGFGYAPEDDPEFARVARLREVLGVEGLADSADPLRPAQVEELFAPAPPRVDDEGIADE